MRIAFSSELASATLLLTLAGCFEPKTEDTACVPREEIPYNSRDEDCDGEDLADLDGDGHNMQGHGGNDCDDEDPDVHPDAEEIPYDGIDNDCRQGDLTDVDGDGFDAEEAGGGDCDDEDASINPGTEEIPYDGVDNDCDGQELRDVDEDGYAAEEAGGDDCDDEDASINPGVEVDDCEGGDEDCDGVEDEDQDADGDGFTTCEDDCDDEDASTYPGAPEITADGIDQDCDGHDLGNCDEWIYDHNFDLENVWINYSDCSSCSSSMTHSIEGFDNIRVPSWATCSDEGWGEISWYGTQDFGVSEITGSWDATIYVYDDDMLEGEVSGSGSTDHCGSCSRASGTFGPD